MDEFDESDFEINEEEKRVESPFFKIAKGAIALLVLLAFLNVFGIRNFFLYRATPRAIQQEEVEVKIDAQILEVPLNIIVLTTSEGENGSKRNRENVLNLVENASRIWEQGGIRLVIKSIHFEEKDNILLGRLYQNPILVINNTQSFDKESINVFLVGNLGGINGVAFGSLNAVAVADYTTVFDFRALAHEVGHLLGLIHVDESRGQLMYQGANGANLSIEEIEIARDNAKIYGE